MASETVVSDHSTVPEEVEKKEVESSEVKKIETERACEIPEKAKPEESEAKIDEKQIEPPIVEQVKEINTDEKPKAEKQAEVCESVEKQTEDKPIEKLPPHEEEKKTEGPPPPVVEASEREIPEEITKETVPEPDKPAIAELTVEKSKCESDEKPAKEEEKPKAEVIEPEKTVDVPKPSPAEAVEAKKEESPVEVVDVTEAKEIGVSEAESKAEETSEPSPVVEEEKPAEICEVAEKNEIGGIVEEKSSEICEVAEKNDKGEIVEGEKKPAEKCEVTEKLEKELPPTCDTVEKVENIETPMDKVEEPKLPKEEEVKEETVAVTSLEQAICAAAEPLVEPKVSEKTEPVVTEELFPCEEKPNANETASIPVPEVLGKTEEAEVISKDIDLKAENGDKTDEPAVEGTKEPEKTVSEEKIEEVVKASEAKLDEKVDETMKDTEEEKHVDETAKTQVQNQECEREDAKTTEDAPKEDVPVKKPSIVKIVKQSLVKAKKAIIGKSHNSKTPPVSEHKDEKPVC